MHFVWEEISGNTSREVGKSDRGEEKANTEYINEQLRLSPTGHCWKMAWKRSCGYYTEGEETRISTDSTHSLESCFGEC